MTEGSLFGWKLQKILQNGLLAGDFASAHQGEALPDAPEGMAWHKNKETGECKLIPQEARIEVDGFPLDVQENQEDWELLSDRVSIESLGGAAIFVPRGESVRSITSLDNSSANLSLPFRIQRTLSSSTIDSGEVTFNSSVGVLGVDYVEHVVLPSDTLQGLCLAYKISATRLRQVNHFSGTSLFLAPKKLIIPLTKKALRSGFIRVQDKETREYKLHALLAELPSLKESEAKAYLEMADWVVEEAIQSARDDGEWEKEVQGAKASDICISFDVQEGKAVGFRTKGAGIPPLSRPGKKAKSAVDETIYEEGVTVEEKKPKIHSKEVYGANVRPQDVYNAADQHNEYGVELKPLADKAENK